MPIASAAAFMARAIGVLQRGRISAYLLYSFITLTATLAVVMR
jgi:hypothetical protein